jgi:hypothetical protein
VIVTQVRVVMLVIRLELLLGGALRGALSEGVSCNEAGDRAGSKQDAKRSHGFSLAGRQLELRSGLGGNSPGRNKQRNSSHRVDVSTIYLFHEVRFGATARVACQPHGVSGGRRRGHGLFPRQRPT